MDPQYFRSRQLSGLSDQIGVSALCDLDEVPIYVGQSEDGIRTRVRRHSTSARSDIIANRMIDVWEIAFVRAWPVENILQISVLEAHLFARFHRDTPLMNGKTMATSASLGFDIPDKQVVQVIAEPLRQDRLQPSLRLPRQIQQYLALIDYIKTVKNENHLRQSLAAHFDRLVAYHNRFLF